MWLLITHTTYCSFSVSTATNSSSVLTLISCFSEINSPSKSSSLLRPANIHKRTINNLTGTDVAQLTDAVSCTWHSTTCFSWYHSRSLTLMIRLQHIECTVINVITIIINIIIITYWTQCGQGSWAVLGQVSVQCSVETMSLVEWQLHTMSLGPCSQTAFSPTHRHTVGDKTAAQLHYMAISPRYHQHHTRVTPTSVLDETCL